MRPTAGGYPLARWCSCCACCLRNSELVCVSTTVAPAYKCRGAHDLAIKAMGDLGLRMRAHSGMEAVEDTLCRPKRTVQFRRYAWAGGGDVSLDLEDCAMQTACEALGAPVPPDWRAHREAIVQEHAVWALHKLPQTAEIAPDDEVKKPPRLTKCACGNYARPGETLCNACTELLVKKTQPAGNM